MISGVHDIEIDRQQQRVVVTGDASPESLLRKLVKSGKHAELWPQNHIQKPLKSPINEESHSKSTASGNQIKTPATKTESPAADPAKPTNSVAENGPIPTPASNNSGKNNEKIGGKTNEEIGGKATVEVKTEEKKPETGTSGEEASPAVVEKKGKQTDGGAVAGAGDDGGEIKKKKKKKEGQNGNKNVTGETSSTTRSTNENVPRQQGYDYKYPASYNHAPPQAPLTAPVYTVSYNTAHPPVNSYTASYYALSPPPQAYVYSHYGSEMTPPPPSPSSEYMQQPVDSFEMFSDENPNGCLVM